MTAAPLDTMLQSANANAVFAKPKGKENISPMLEQHIANTLGVTTLNVFTWLHLSFWRLQRHPWTEAALTPQRTERLISFISISC